MKLKLLALLLVAIRLNGQGKLQDSLHLSLIDSNLKAQTQNQSSQAEYYSNLKTNSGTDLAPIFSVLLAGLISFGTAAYFSIQAIKKEKEKSIAMQEKELLTAKRLAASNLISKTAQGIHNITWVLWIARFTPDLFMDINVQEHDKKMNILYSEIVAAQVTLAAYDKDLYESTKEIVDELYGFDGNLGGAAGGLYRPAERKQAIKELGKMWPDVHEYLMSIPALFSAKL